MLENKGRCRANFREGFFIYKKAPRVSELTEELKIIVIKLNIYAPTFDIETVLISNHHYTLSH